MIHLANLSGMNHPPQQAYEAQGMSSSSVSINGPQFSPSWTPPMLRVSTQQQQQQMSNDSGSPVDPISLSFTPSPDDLQPKDV